MDRDDVPEDEAAELDYPFDDEDPETPTLIPEAGPGPRVLPGGIELRELIGEGGMGQVYLGYHLTLGREVAIKILDPALRLRADSQARLLREGLVLANIQHQSVVDIYHCDRTASGELFIVMELLRGENLRQIRMRRGRLDPLHVVDIGLQVCGALEAAHDAGVVHRDLTPSNVMVLFEPAGRVKVIDFGICRVLDTFFARHPQRFATPPGSRLATPVGLQFGNPEYMAPELLVREPFVAPNFATDVFSLGVILFELLTDEHPFTRGDRKQARRVHDVLPGFDHVDLENALANALRSDPGRRTPTMAALREDLELARECILAQSEEHPAERTVHARASLRLVHPEPRRPPPDDERERGDDDEGDEEDEEAEDEAAEEPRARFLTVIPGGNSGLGYPSEPSTDISVDRAAPERPTAAVEPGRGAPAAPVSASLSSTPSSWLAAHMTSLALGAGVLVGAGATLASEHVRDSGSILLSQLEASEAAAALCEQTLAQTRESLAQAEDAARGGERRIEELSRDPPERSVDPSRTGPSPSSPDAASASSAKMNPHARQRAVRRSLGTVHAGVRDCHDEFGGSRASTLAVRVRVDADGRASAVELPGKTHSSLIECVSAAIRTRRYATGDAAEWVRHTFVFDLTEEAP